MQSLAVSFNTLLAALSRAFASGVEFEQRANPSRRRPSKGPKIAPSLRGPAPVRPPPRASQPRVSRTASLPFRSCPAGSRSPKAPTRPHRAPCSAHPHLADPPTTRPDRPSPRPNRHSRHSPKALIFGPNASSQRRNTPGPGPNTATAIPPAHTIAPHKPAALASHHGALTQARRALTEARPRPKPSALTPQPTRSHGRLAAPYTPDARHTTDPNPNPRTHRRALTPPRCASTPPRNPRP